MAKTGSLQIKIMNSHRIQISLVVALAASTLAANAAMPRKVNNDYGVPAPGSYTLPIIRAAADGEVLDSEGEPLRLRELTRGRVTVMSFIYTRCAAAKACPFATGVLREIHRISADDAALAKELRLVSMSFDPMVDTPERMAAYAAIAAELPAAAPWQFLTARSQAELQPILEAYGQAVDRKANRFDPTGPLNHALRVFLIDRNGNIRNIYSSDTLDVQFVLADVKTLMMESPSVAPAVVQKPEKVHTVAFFPTTEARVTEHKKALETN